MELTREPTIEKEWHWRRLEVVESMSAFVAARLDCLKPVAESWQPQDFLPSMGVEDWVDEVSQLRQAAAVLPDDLLVVLVGDMVTEEALPSYQAFLTRLAGVADATGVSESPWAQWSRQWTAEENRHGDLLHHYLYLSGRVDMAAVQRTIQYLLCNGFDAGDGGDPYRAFIYTSFQERATRISHRNVARLAQRAGDGYLSRICATIAGDEARHEKAYTAFVKRIFELDPNGAMLALRDMMKDGIAMPGQYMEDGEQENLFDAFANVAQRLGVYTARDYAEIMRHLIGQWQVGRVAGLAPAAAQAQEYLCDLPRRYQRLADRLDTGVAQMPQRPFSWIYGREA